MHLFPKCLFLKSASGKKQRIKAQQSQVTQDALAACVPPAIPPGGKGGMKVNTALAVLSLGNHNLEGAKAHQEVCTANFPQLRPKLCSSPW